MDQREIFINKAKPIYELIDNSLFDRARTSAQAISVKGTIQTRMREHLLALIDLRSGNFRPALNRLQNACHNYGSHIGMLSDICSCYYHMDKIQDWKKSLKILRTTFSKNISKLSIQSHYKTTIMLCNFLEEEGSIADSLQILEESLEKIDQTNNEEEFCILLAATLRIKSSFNQTHKLSQIYRELIELKYNKPNIYMSFEIQHALILAEISMVGPQSALARVKSVFNDPNLLEEDARLIYYDFIEEVLVRGFKIPQEFNEIACNKKHLNEFENQIQAIVDNQNHDFNLTTIATLSHKISLACYIRILSLYLRTIKNTINKREIQKKLYLILSSLNQKSRILWKKRLYDLLNGYNTSGKTIIKVNTQTGQLSCSQNKLSIPKRKISLNILKILTKKETTTLTHLTKNIWSANFNPSYYHRIRIAINRLNEMLFQISGIQDILKIDSEKVEVHPHIKIIS
jgi:hypothetical protein